MPLPPDTSAQAPPPTPEQPERRAFIGGASIALIGALSAAGAVPVVAVLLDPLGKEAVQRGSGLVAIGAVTTFQEGQPTEVELRAEKKDAWSSFGVVTVGRVYVTKQPDGKFQIFTSRCPHQGCTVTYQPDSQRFFCPCHDGYFNKSGEQVEGPPRRGLDPLAYEIKDEQLMVRYQRFKTGGADRVSE